MIEDAVPTGSDARRVLIVDDDRDFADSMADLLEASGFEAMTVYEAGGAVEVVQDFSPHVALLDIRLGQASGIDLIAQLTVLRPGLLCVMVSAYPALDTAVAALHENAFDYLRKPIGARHLLASINRCFDRVQLEREKTKAQEALRRQQEEYRIIFDSVPAMIFRLHPNHTILRVNQAAAEFLGQTQEALVGKTLDEALPADLARRWDETLDKVMAQDTAERGVVDQWVVVPDEVRWTLTDAVPFRGEEGGESGVVVLAYDITEQRRMEERLKTSQKMEAIGLLAGGMAHDFNNILQTVQGNLDLILDALECGEIPSSDDVLEGQKAVEQASRLTQRILSLGRRTPVNTEDLDLNQSIADVGKMLLRTLGPKIEFSMAPASGLKAVRADPGQMQQVLMNLCLNARDAMPEGGKISLRTKMVKADARFCATRPWAQDRAYVALRVSDTGCGIDEQTRDRIFEPFFTTKGQGRGAGLGLATVYSIVEQLGGGVEVESEVGQGTTFQIFLPAVEQEMADGKRSHGERSLPHSVETVLIAEDDDLVRKLNTRILNSGGYEVFVASDGEEAIEIFEKHHGNIDLLLLDAVMPKKSGRAVYEYVKRRNPRARVLFCTGYSANALPASAFPHEKTPTIYKPCTKSQLLLKVRETLDAAN